MLYDVMLRRGFIAVLAGTATLSGCTGTSDTIDNRLASVVETWVNKRDDSAAAQVAVKTYQSLQKSIENNQTKAARTCN